MPNYTPPAFVARTASQKPLRGARVLDKEDADRKAETHEKRVKGLVKKRDRRCRWPEPHVCRKGFECAHIVDASLLGAMATENLIYVCGWIHRRGPESIHGKQLKVEKDTERGADWTLAFYRRDKSGVYQLVAREVRPGELERY